MCSIQCMLNLSQITYRKVRHRQYSNHFESELGFIATMSQSFCCSIRLFWIFGAQKLPHWGLIFGSNTKQLWFSMQPSILTTFDLILEFLKAFFGPVVNSLGWGKVCECFWVYWFSLTTFNFLCSLFNWGRVFFVALMEFFDGGSKVHKCFLGLLVLINNFYFLYSLQFLVMILNSFLGLLDFLGLKWAFWGLEVRFKNCFVVYLYS